MTRSILLPLSVSLLALASGASAQQQSDDQSNIVVTARSLENTSRDLAACLERGCPPEEDIAASLAYAENLFVAGEYRDASSILRKAIGRNSRYDERLPEEVSGLYRAYSRVSEHLGEANSFKLATLDARDALEAGFDDNDPRVLLADLDVGDSRAKLGHPDDARVIYERVEKEALAAGQPRVATYARLRQALLDDSRFVTTRNDVYRRRFVQQLQEIRQKPLEGAEDLGLIAEVMLARVDRRDGKDASTEDLIRRFAERGGVKRPMLLYSAPLYTDADLDRESARPNSGNARLTSLSRNHPTWADVAFWVNADGVVEDFEVLRSQGETGWLDQVKRHVNSRRYAPVARDGEIPGFYIIERYTITQRFAQTTGTRLRVREPVQRIERLDLTPENYEQPALTQTS